MERGNTDLTYPRVLGVCQFNFQESDQLLNIQIVSGSADPAAVAFGILTITPHFFSRMRYNLDRKLNKPNWNAPQIRGLYRVDSKCHCSGISGTGYNLNIKKKPFLFPPPFPFFSIYA